MTSTSTLIPTLLALIGLLALGCGEGDEPADAGPSAADMSAADDLPDAARSDAGPPDAAPADAEPAPLEPPIPLRPDLCDGPVDMAALRASLMDGGEGPSYGEMNPEQAQRMLQDPTSGPFYMVNLIKYRERAVYADGRETDLTGREADALYAPVEFLSAIGARAVYVGTVGRIIDGDDIVWERIAIVEYPCPYALFAMSAHPEFKARAVHKDAGLESSVVMVTHLQPSPLPEGFAPPESPFPATAEDPAFDMVHVMRFNETAQYEDGVDEPERTGLEAWEQYAAAGSAATQRLGIYPLARFVVQGVFIGDGRVVDEIRMLRMPSMAAFEALLDDETRQAGQYHRTAALAENTSMASYPQIMVIPGAPGQDGGGVPPVTEDGTGTLCQSDDDCPSEGPTLCLGGDDGTGFCTTEGCAAGGCPGSYVCCRDCSAAVAALLPFDGSACLPADATEQLTSAPASCTCD